ncbi:hypothetical protein ACF0HT_14010 (plasmid) [Staphylococcus xylosus]|uniref:hypothetical protein n=1 Tax=Staphylococcus xylosus TaxID=1288 RepID=UPI002DB99344|nr:hypothetical protein [Staphylococcus xylosus]MEB8123129.1 hypothetical protein [Staphylococcus xylosus]
MNKPYRIVNYHTKLEDEIEEEHEVLYTLQDVNTGAYCGVMFNEWDIRKVEYGN